VDATIRAAAQQGRVTPLEADEAMRRVRVTTEPQALRQAYHIEIAEPDSVDWSQLRPHLRPVATFHPAPQAPPAVPPIHRSAVA
jgi:hypothetical protein